ncbi:MAG: acyltransferase [Solirubrobacterales bacterium]
MKTAQRTGRDGPVSTGERSPRAEDQPTAGGDARDPGKERRASAGIPIVPVFDGYRAYAILAIVILHALQNAALSWGPTGNRFQLLLWASDPGESCLDALFIVSGFVMFLPVAARNGDLGSVKAFAIRRAARLVPAYWLVLVLMLVLIVAVPLSPPIRFPGATEIGLTFTTLEVPAEFVRNQYFIGFEINRAIWTLSADVIFYVVLVLFATQYFRRPFVGLVIAAAIAVAWRLFFNNFDSLVAAFGGSVSPETMTNLLRDAEIQFPYWAFSFGVGMTSAWLYVMVHERRRFRSLPRHADRIQLAAIAALACVVVAVAIAKPASIRHSPIAALSFTSVLGVFMLSTALASRARQRLFSNRPARWLGDISYGIYLIHLVVITYLARLFAMPHGTLRAALVWCGIVVPVSVAWGYLSMRFVERPVRLRAQQYVRRYRHSAAAP